MPDLTCAVDDYVALVTLNRPHKANALTDEMFSGLVEIYTEAAARPDIRVVVLTGAGRHFCAGGDVKRPQGEGLGGPDRSAAMARERVKTLVQTVPKALYNLDKPVIAAVNGAAVGAGLDLALMCDLRFGAQSATFAAAYIRVGLIPGQGGSYFLPRVVGLPKALELLLTGDQIDAAEAYRIGMINRLYSDEDLMPRTLEFAARLAATPPVHVQLTKRAVYSSLTSTLDTSLELSASHMAIVQSLEDSKEARAAWLEHRPATFTGR
jgi:enoyl-CoA hydratase/carnithine racemase